MHQPDHFKSYVFLQRKVYFLVCYVLRSIQEYLLVVTRLVLDSSLQIHDSCPSLHVEVSSCVPIRNSCVRFTVLLDPPSSDIFLRNFMLWPETFGQESNWRMLGGGDLFRFGHMHRVVIHLCSRSDSTAPAVSTSSIAGTLSPPWPAYHVATLTQHVFRRIQSTMLLQVGVSDGTCSEYDGFLQQHLFSLRVAVIDRQRNHGLRHL